jgi:catechol 2,3-dioxygenase-like lactoylglutathione lyase family enzyme
MKSLLLGLFLGAVATGASMQAAKPDPKQAAKSLELGNFSVSLNVKDIAASREFYEKLGFKPTMGEAKKHWLIMQNETGTIGLFQGVFPANGLTFNPGWDRTGKPLTAFQDVREIQRALKSAGLTLKTEADEKTTGPAFIALVDPDGNSIAIDQHVPAPGK